MKVIVMHCPECDERQQHMVDRDGSCICLTCTYVQFTHPTRYLKDEE